MLSYKFKNGSVVNGTIEQILAIANLLGENVDGLTEVPEGYYPSASKGLVLIKDMNEIHIKNAINKLAYQYYSELGKEDISIDEYLSRFVKLVEVPKLLELWEELFNRSKIPA